MITIGQAFTFVIILSLLLGFGYYIYISNFASNKKYKCEDNQCIKATSDDDGVYTSDDCDNACGDDPPPDDKNVCEGHEKDSATSAYPITCDTTLGACTIGQNMTCSEMNYCTDGKCEDLKDNPNYQTESDCEKNCQILATAYTCSGNKKCEKVEDTTFNWQDDYIWSSKDACNQALASGLCNSGAEKDACSNKDSTQSDSGKCCGKVQLQNRYCSQNKTAEACNGDSANNGQNKCCWDKEEESCPNACFSFKKKSGTTTDTTPCTNKEKSGDKNTTDVAEKCYGFDEFKNCRANSNMSDSWEVLKTTCCGWGPNNDGDRNPLGTDINLPLCKGTRIQGSDGTNAQTKCLNAKNGYSNLCNNEDNGCYFSGQVSDHVNATNLYYQCILDDNNFSSVYQCKPPQ